MKRLVPSSLSLLNLTVPAALLIANACSDSASPPGGTGGTTSTATGGTSTTSTGGIVSTGTGGTSTTSTGGIVGTGTGGTVGTSTGGTATSTGGTTTGTTGGTATGTTGGTATGTTGGTSTAGASTGGDGTAGGSSTGGSAPVTKMCAKKTTLTVPLMTNFDTYDGMVALDKWVFAFNGAATDPGVLYAGPFPNNDGTGTPFTGMVGGANSSTYAISASNPMATGWGGGVGFWMGCFNASAYAGLSFYARSTAAPTGKMVVAMSMEQTSPPAMDPAGGGTCDAGAMCKSPEAAIAITADWTLIKIPWSMFTPGVGSGMLAVAPTGDGIAGLIFQVGMVYVQDPADATKYIPTPGPYDLQLDDLGFY